MLPCCIATSVHCFAPRWSLSSASDDNVLRQNDALLCSTALKAMYMCIRKSFSAKIVADLPALLCMILSQSLDIDLHIVNTLIYFRMPTSSSQYRVHLQNSVLLIYLLLTDYTRYPRSRRWGILFAILNTLNSTLFLLQYSLLPSKIVWEGRGVSRPCQSCSTV